MNEPTRKLPGAADQLLQSFPANEPDFEAQAKAIEARIAADGANAGVAFDDLLKAPALGAEPGEPGAPSEMRAATAPKTNFAEIARRSLQKKDDSAELAKELLAATAQSRRPDAQMVERVRAATRAGATGTPLPASSRQSSADREATSEEAARPSGVVARALPAPQPVSNQRGTIIGIVGVAFGIAACVALFLKSGESQSPTSATLAAEKAAPQAAIPPAAPHAAPPARPAEPGVVSPEALAAAPGAVAAHEPAKSAPRGLAAAPSLAAPSKAGRAPSAVAEQQVELDEDPPRAVAAAEPKTAPATPEPPLKPAQGSSGDVPLTPSAGALSTALGSVRGGAQACLAGQTESVNAVVTFAADGHVLRVSAGGPSGACIQAALSKARIAPFARESFSATTTIRPP
jgi:hypothetical protein